MTGTVYEDRYTRTFTIISCPVLLRMRNISGEICKENQNNHLLTNNCFNEFRVIYEIMWKNMVEPDSLQMTV
jgi:hypothetical protein